MIAYKVQVETDAARTRAGSRAGQAAAQVRRNRAARARQRTLRFVLGGLALATVALLGYLWLMAATYRLSYDLHNLNERGTALREQSARLEDRIAQLESRDRLAAIAEQLGMREPRVWAVATVPPVVEKPHGLAFLPFTSNWLR
jgi:cell division protein FtsL